MLQQLPLEHHVLREPARDKQREPSAKRTRGRRVTRHPSLSKHSPKTTRDGPTYDALVTDINMPEMSGVDLVRHLERSGHVRPTVFISGYFAEELDLQEFKDDCYGFLSKPVARQKLADALHDCIRRYRPPVARTPPSNLLL